MRLLVVSYYFPPAGGAGVQRVLKWVKYLRDFGVDPVVLTVDAGAYPSLDSSLEQDVPPGIEIHRTRALDPFGVYAMLQGRSRQEAVADATGRISQAASPTARAARWLRANVFIPDARVGWMPFAVREGLRLVRTGGIDAILTSGPPHTVHLIGAALQHRTALPWVADFRDPWVEIHYNRKLPRNALARKLDGVLERAVLRRADAVTTVSPSLHRLLDGKIKRRKGDIRVIYNGYDDEDFDENYSDVDSGMFTLCYVGTLYEHPHPVWKALARLRAVKDHLRLRVRLVGSVPHDTGEVLATYGLSDCAEIVPYVSHTEAVREMRRATALLLTIEDWPHSEIVMPGKMYEYLASGRPIVGIGPPHGDAAKVLDETGAGLMSSPTDQEGVFEHLTRLYVRWEAGNALGGTSLDTLRPYSRRAQTQHLASILHRVARGNV